MYVYRTIGNSFILLLWNIYKEIHTEHTADIDDQE